jgi:hypothetical protein
MIVALAGRRTDAEGATEARFPLDRAEAVAERLRSRLLRLGATALVCSAARGADLIALQVAEDLGIRRSVVLPGGAAEFRAASVVDGLENRDGLEDGRQGNYAWGKIFDRVHRAVEAQGDLVVSFVPNQSGHDQHASDGGDQAYLAANLAILDRAAELAAQSGVAVTAVVVWNLASRGPDDITAAFRAEAQRRGLAIEEISTL